MKIEVGESLFYSWLRHVKDCTIVQTNWKTSPQWILQKEDMLQVLYDAFSDAFTAAFGEEASVFNQTTSLAQFLRQAECDVLGVNLQNETPEYYAVEVAFHEGGLNYQGKQATALKVAAKCIRTALCLMGYMNTQKAEIIFASPKIIPSVQEALKPCIELVNQVFKQNKLGFHVRLICNSDFQTMVLDPILLLSGNVADTSELFLRSYQMYSLFTSAEKDEPKRTPEKRIINTPSQLQQYSSAYQEMKIGNLANTVLRGLLESSGISKTELKALQTAEYSKTAFHLQYPALTTNRTGSDSIRYYSVPLTIHGGVYYLCSQWFETPVNNDRPYLEKWIAEHQGQ